MYRSGHVGVWLILYAPIAFVLASVGRPIFALLGAAIVLVVEPIPDRDQRVPFLKHRGFSHTFGFALLTGVVVGFAGWFLGDQLFVLAGEWVIGSGFADVGNRLIAARTVIDAPRLATFGFVVGTFAIVAHLVGDVLTPMGIRPLWPLSDRSFSLSLTTAKNPVANALLLLLGVIATGGAVWFSATGAAL